MHLLSLPLAACRLPSTAAVGPCADPGLSGACAVLGANDTLVALYDVPTLTIRTARGSRTEYDLPGMARLLAPYAGLQSHVLIEEAQAMPGQGTRSMFKCQTKSFLV